MAGRVGIVVTYPRRLQMDQVLMFVLGLAAGVAITLLLTALLRRGGDSSGRLIGELRAQNERAIQDAAVLQRSLDAQTQLRVQAQTKLEEAVKNVEQQRSMLEDARSKLVDAFKAASGDALAQNNQMFLELAHKTFDAVMAQAQGDVAKRQQAIDAVIKPLNEMMSRYESQIGELEKSRQAAYGSLSSQVEGLAVAQQQLQKETANLVTALRRPEVRGRWGEVTLHRVVELAGMSDHCDYAEQVSVEAIRPDMVVNLPGGRQIVIDAKVALDAYLEAISASSDEQRQVHLARHARQMRSHMEKLSAKTYWEQFGQAPEFVVMFIPGESFFAAAIDSDRTLIEAGMEKRVILATPTTLIALLRSVAFGWRQEQIARNALEISALGKDLYDRLRTFASHVINTGRALRNAVENYNKAVGSMELRVMPAARKFKDLGSTAGEEIPAIEQVDSTPTTLGGLDMPGHDDNFTLPKEPPPAQA